MISMGRGVSFASNDALDVSMIYVFLLPQPRSTIRPTQTFRSDYTECREPTSSSRLSPRRTHGVVASFAVVVFRVAVVVRRVRTHNAIFEVGLVQCMPSDCFSTATEIMIIMMIISRDRN